MADKAKLVSNTKIYLDTRLLLDTVLFVTVDFPRYYKYSVGARMHDISITLLQRIAAAYINHDRLTRIQHLIDFQTDFETLKTLVRRLNDADTLRRIRHAVCAINSYLGLLRPFNEYAHRRKVLKMIDPAKLEYVYTKKDYKVLALRDEYKPITKLTQRIRDGDY